jgi:hypothetical protein
MAQIPCFAITGHHRSATSLVSSLLQSAGLNVGERLLGADPSNRHGHYEDLDFLDFHIDVLNSQGFGFEGYILQKVIPVQQQHVTRAREMVAARMRFGQPWGWKDPRTVLFLDFWKNLVPNLGFVCLFRAPWEVVDSQFRRGHAMFKTNPNLAIQVWMTYNQAILEFADRYPEQCLILEGPAVGANPAVLIEAMTRKFGVTLGQPEKRYDGEILLHHDSSHLPSLIQHFFPETIEIYQKLRERAEVAADNCCASEKTAVGASLDWALQHWHDLREMDRKLKSQAMLKDQELGQQRESLARLTAEIEERQRTCAGATQQLFLMEEAKAGLEQALRESGGRQEMLQAQVDQANRERSHTQKQFVQLQKSQALSLRLRDEAEARAREHLAQVQQFQAIAEDLRLEREQLATQLEGMGHEMELLKQAGEEAKVVARQLRSEKEAAERLICRHQEREAEVHSRLSGTSALLESVSLRLSDSEDLMRRMESSKFWILRRAWFKIKKRVYKQAG